MSACAGIDDNGSVTKLVRSIRVEGACGTRGEKGYSVRAAQNGLRCIRFRVSWVNLDVGDAKPLQPNTLSHRPTLETATRRGSIAWLTNHKLRSTPAASHQHPLPCPSIASNANRVQGFIEEDH